MKYAIFMLKRLEGVGMGDIGEVSGCLEIIGGYEDAECDINNIIIELAEKVWNDSEWCKKGHGSFQDYYNLDENETKLYYAKEIMPESFIQKYKNNTDIETELKNTNILLYHKQTPNTLSNLLEGYRSGKLYKVKCNICNRVFCMDYNSFHCVKWQSCTGADCWATTVDQSNIDYLNSLYDFQKNTNVLQASDNQLVEAEKISNSLTYYGQDNTLKIAYISDIHLDSHLKFYDNKRIMIRDIVDKLYATMDNSDIILFNGDVASETDMVVDFYKFFVRRYDYYFYKRYKSELSHIKEAKLKLLIQDNVNVDNRRKGLAEYIEKRKREILKFDFESLISFKEKGNYYRFEDAFEHFTFSKFCKHSLTYDEENQVRNIIKLMDLHVYYSKFLDNSAMQMKIDNIEKNYGKPIENINVTDYQHVVLDNIYVVLGNHEFSEFEDIKSGVDYYKREFSKIGVKLLHNNSFEYDKFLIYGGTGFAKYDLDLNANKIICCKNFTREDEIIETDLFESEYKCALQYAKEKKLCFLCVSHYPVEACLNGIYDKDAIYFNGHTHRNKFLKSLDKILYADNQVGYKNRNIIFRIATTGYELNPYYFLKDGMYKTSIKDYLQFNRYINENVGTGSILYRKCQNGKSDLYVVKHNGYYGFFIVTLLGKQKGIYIVNGGRIKKISASTDMNWICENFDAILSKYLMALIPLRKIQNELSREIKELGLDGTIHGCIVDIDYYHHIMLDPIENAVTLYYSPFFGEIVPLFSFDEVIDSIKEHKGRYIRPLINKYITNLNKNEKLFVILNAEQTAYDIVIDMITKNCDMIRNKYNRMIKKMNFCWENCRQKII